MKLTLSSDGEYLEWRSPSGNQYSWDIEEPVESTEEFLEFLTAVIAWKRNKLTAGDSVYTPANPLKELAVRVKSLEKAVQELCARQQDTHLDQEASYIRLQERSAEFQIAIIKRLEALESRHTEIELARRYQDRRINELEKQAQSTETRLNKLKEV